MREETVEAVTVKFVTVKLNGLAPSAPVASAVVPFVLKVPASESPKLQSHISVALTRLGLTNRQTATAAKTKRATGLRERMRQNLFMRESPLAGSNTSWTANGKPSMRVRGNAPRAVALVATDLAARLMPKTLCKSRAKPKMWDELGIWRTNWADSPQWVERFAPVGGAIRTSGWSDSHQWVERFAPLPTGGWSDSPVPTAPYGQTSATRSASSARPKNTTGQSTLRCPAQREITRAASGSGQRTRRRRNIE